MYSDYSMYSTVYSMYSTVYSMYSTVYSMYSTIYSMYSMYSVAHRQWREPFIYILHIYGDRE